MSPIEEKLLAALRELESAATNAGREPRPDFPALFARIDELSAGLPRGASVDLRHYLAKKSYQKARLWLEGLDAQNARGQCDR